MEKVTVFELGNLVSKSIIYKDTKKCIFSIHNNRTEIDMVIPHKGTYNHDLLFDIGDILTFSFFFFETGKALQKKYEVIDDE